MNADILKTELLKYYREKRGFYICATEVDNEIERADVLLMNDKEIIEIEVKMNWKDFLADFKTKSKHIIPPAKPNLKYVFLKANRFFFCVPNSLGDRCNHYLIDNNYDYGLIVFSGVLTQIKRCKRLKELDEYETKRLRKNIIFRATSELVKLRYEKMEKEIRKGIIDERQV